eukprot:9417178-Prorocentrum_lima.AAC.1
METDDELLLLKRLVEDLELQVRRGSLDTVIASLSMLPTALSMRVNQVKMPILSADATLDVMANADVLVVRLCAALRINAR